MANIQTQWDVLPNITLPAVLEIFLAGEMLENMPELIPVRLTFIHKHVYYVHTYVYTMLLKSHKVSVYNTQAEKYDFGMKASKSGRTILLKKKSFASLDKKTSLFDKGI